MSPPFSLRSPRGVRTNRSRSNSSNMRALAVKSSFSAIFAYVKGHKVKTQYAPLLRAIFDKYGDITRGSDVKSPDLSIFLERICNIYQRLQQTSFLDLKRPEVEDMIRELEAFQSRNLRVGWILDWLQYIYQTRISFHYYQIFKEQEAKVIASIGCLEKDLEGYEEVSQISLIKEVVMHITEDDQIKAVAEDIKIRVFDLQQQSLV